MSPAELQAAVTAEIVRYGSLDRALSALAHDANAAPWGAPVYDIYRAAVTEWSRQQEAADPTLKAKRLRTRAVDERAAYQRYMDAYGEAAGRSQYRLNQGEIELSKSFAREAAACLACATDCLIAAEQAEREADGLSRWIVLFDGVSAKWEAA